MQQANICNFVSNLLSKTYVFICFPVNFHYYNYNYYFVHCNHKANTSTSKSSPTSYTLHTIPEILQ